jgi:hypothetical protein
MQRHNYIIKQDIHGWILYYLNGCPVLSEEDTPICFKTYEDAEKYAKVIGLNNI